jgi:hypothetical protein
MKDNSSFFYDVIMPSVIQNVTPNHRRNTLNLFFIHLDNTPPDNSKQSRERIQASKATRLPHLVHSPDLAPRDFFLFGDRNEELTSSTARPEMNSEVSSS